MNDAKRMRMTDGIENLQEQIDTRPNIEAVRPLVFATALLLILVVLSTNLTAIVVRNHLRRRNAGSAL